VKTLVFQLHVFCLRICATWLLYLFQKDNWTFTRTAYATTRVHVKEARYCPSVSCFINKATVIWTNRPSAMCHTLVLQNLKCLSELYLPWNRTVSIKRIGGLNKYFGLIYFNKTYDKWKMMQGQLYSTKREQRRLYVLTSNISRPSS
jgi:hypothetical protein